MEQKNRSMSLLKDSVPPIILNFTAIILMCIFKADVKDILPISALIACFLAPALKEFFSDENNINSKLYIGGYVIVGLYLFIVFTIKPNDILPHCLEKTTRIILSNIWYSALTTGFFYGLSLVVCSKLYKKRTHNKK
ncbi:hypothetical protein ACOMA7_05595 [Apilactobacillus sp. 1-1-2]|uniref:hypothetical protein n=1 Tax=Apilactobacillus sp. 1-1-2 TaxID=3411035 RepID=UPI003B92D335